LICALTKRRRSSAGSFSRGLPMAAPRLPAACALSHDRCSTGRCGGGPRQSPHTRIPSARTPSERSDSCRDERGDADPDHLVKLGTRLRCAGGIPVAVARQRWTEVDRE
jgi:hypothetical protein